MKMMHNDPRSLMKKKCLSLMIAMLVLVLMIPMQIHADTTDNTQDTITVQENDISTNDPDDTEPDEPAAQIILNDWEEIDGHWYYHADDGEIIKSTWQNLNKKWYHFDASGIMESGWQKVNNKWYYLGSADDGAMKTGWQKINNKWYYLGSADDGAMKTGWQKINNKWYYLGSADDGAMKTGWQKINNKWYYLGSADDGAMKTGWQKINNKWYYLGSANDGAMKTGWQKINNKWYYLGSANDGAMKTGWQQIDGKWYYMYENGVMAANTRTPDGYWVNKSGVWEKKGSGKLIVIDPGHQTHANTAKEPIGPGATTYKAKVTGGATGVSTKQTEYQLNLSVSLKLRDILEQRGYQVIMVRTTNDVNISNAERAKIANDANADAFIRIHADSSESSSAQGAMTICQTKNNPYNAYLYTKNRRLSEKVLDGIVSSTGCKRRSIMETDTMSGINWCTVPTTIVEMGFLSNPTEDKLMATSAYQQKIATGIANGIDAYFDK